MDHTKLLLAIREIIDSDLPDEEKLANIELVFALNVLPPNVASND